MTCTLEEAQEESFRFSCGKCREASTLKCQVWALKVELEEARDRQGSRTRGVGCEESTGRAGLGQEGVPEVPQPEAVSVQEESQETLEVTEAEEVRTRVVRRGETVGTVVQEGVRTSTTTSSRGGTVRQELVVGDSLVRKVDTVFCGEDRENRVRVCFPGARIGDIEDRIEELVKSSGDRPLVALQVGTNQLGEGSESVVQGYSALLDKVEGLECDVLVTGILPRFNMSSMLASRIVGVNRRIERMCRQRGIAFRDLWEEFAGKREMYREDRLHLSQKGADIFGGIMRQWADQQQGN